MSGIDLLSDVALALFSPHVFHSEAMRLLFLFILTVYLSSEVTLGVDRFFAQEDEGHKKKNIGLITNHTAVNRDGVATYTLFDQKGYKVKALFTPEHGLYGNAYAFEHVKSETKGGRPIYSLHGDTRRPTEKMLAGIDQLVFDIQDIGVRSYTYISTLFYVMEEAAKRKIPLRVLDRPNPINGVTVDGPMLEEKWRSFIGYINVPYCHGMTVGELATYYNKEYKIGCDLQVVKMEGWKREMSFAETGLRWVPTSPNIPESDTPLFYASTGMLGELGIVSIGIGYTLPFKVVGATWVNAEKYAELLNSQKLPGVDFMPFHYKPFFGSFKNSECHGVLIQVTNRLTYRPLDVQFALIGILKSLYPDKFRNALNKISKGHRELFCKAAGNSLLLEKLEKEKYLTWKLIGFQKEARKQFIEKRAKYLLY